MVKDGVTMERRKESGVMPCLRGVHAAAQAAAPLLCPHHGTHLPGAGGAVGRCEAGRARIRESERHGLLGDWDRELERKRGKTMTEVGCEAKDVVRGC